MIALDVFKAAYGSLVGQPNYNPEADLDGDGRVTITDWNRYVQLMKAEKATTAVTEQQSFFRLNNPILWLAVLGLLAVVGSNKKR